MFHLLSYNRKIILFRTRTARNGRPVTALGTANRGAAAAAGSKQPNGRPVTVLGTTHRGGGGRLAPAVG